MIEIGGGYVPAFITEDVLPSAPRAGQGVHRYLFDLARLLTPYRSPDTIQEILRTYAEGCGRRVPETELKAAIRDGARYAWRPNSPIDSIDAALASFPPPPEPKFDLKAFQRFATTLPDVDADWFYRRSPIAPWNRTPASFLHALYQKGEKIVIFDDFKSQGQALWTHPALPYDAHTLNAFSQGKRFGVWFLSNPVDGEFRINDAGDMSRRSHQNVTSWRYLVFESDREEITAAQWLAALAQLPLPIAAIYETGGRLPHALLRVNAASKEQWDDIRSPRSASHHDGRRSKLAVRRPPFPAPSL